MTTLKADFLYEVGGLWISEEMFGKSLGLVHDDYAMEVTFPRSTAANWVEAVAGLCDAATMARSCCLMIQQHRRLRTLQPAVNLT